MGTGKLTGKRVAIYARYSTDRQRPASIEDQIRICTEFVEREGGTVGEVYRDEATSGASLDRAGFDAMMTAIGQKPSSIDAIVTEDISRISRDVGDTGRVFRWLRFLGVVLMGAADGVDTSGPAGKMGGYLRALVAEANLDDIGHETHRGMVGRHISGGATGGLPYGYRNAPTGEDDNRRIVVDPQEAKVVQRIFAEFAAGRSLGKIAEGLNADGVPPPRSRHRGWIASAIREMVRNEKYIGVWIFNRREWRKAPGTNRRVPRMRPESEWIRKEHPDRRIVDAATWQGAQLRIGTTQRIYGRKPGDARDGRGRPSRYLLTGLLRCGCCQGRMNLQGPAGRVHYRCSDRAKRGTCDNTLTVREDLLRPRVLDEIKEMICSQEVIRHARREFTAEVRRRQRSGGSELAEHRKRLAHIEAQISNLVDFVAAGDSSTEVRLRLRELEAQASNERAAIAKAGRTVDGPIRLPSTEWITQRVFDLDRVLAEDVAAGREALRRLLRGGFFEMHPGDDGFYTVTADVLPLAVLLIDNAAPGVSGAAPVINRGCGGRI